MSQVHDTAYPVFSADVGQADLDTLFVDGRLHYDAGYRLLRQQIRT
jgi:hypothetical protein